MKLSKVLIFTMFLCFVFPFFSNAEPIDDATAAVNAKDYKKAYELLTPLAEENNLLAKTLLGTLYFKGQGVDVDVNKGMAMITDAATQGFGMAEKLAAALTMEMAALGDVKALYNAGYMCLKGWGGEQNPNACVQLLEKAGENGHEKSAKVLSSIFTKGKYGIAPDKGKADYWNKKLGK